MLRAHVYRILAENQQSESEEISCAVLVINTSNEVGSSFLTAILLSWAVALTDSTLSYISETES